MVSEKQDTCDSCQSTDCSAMQMKDGENPEEFEERQELMRHFERIKDGIQLIRNDILFTKRLGKKVQDGLDDRLAEDVGSMYKPVPVPHGIWFFGLDLVRAVLPKRDSPAGSSGQGWHLGDAEPLADHERGQ